MILDLGTNVGYTAAHLAYLYPTARLIGLEPDPGNYEIAVRNTRPWSDRITLIEAAVWSSDGSVELVGEDEDSFRVSSSCGQADLREGRHERMIRSRSIDSIVQEFQVARIDYLKVDIEGAEAEILLRGDAYWLDLARVIKIEIHAPATYHQLHDTLTARGFQCRKDIKHWACIVATRP